MSMSRTYLQYKNVSQLFRLTKQNLSSRLETHNKQIGQDKSGSVPEADVSRGHYDGPEERGKWGEKPLDALLYT